MTPPHTHTQNTHTHETYYDTKHIRSDIRYTCNFVNIHWYKAPEERQRVVIRRTSFSNVEKKRKTEKEREKKKDNAPFYTNFP